MTTFPHPPEVPSENGKDPVYMGPPQPDNHEGASDATLPLTETFRTRDRGDHPLMARSRCSARLGRGWYDAMDSTETPYMAGKKAVPTNDL